jgi:hypothetical protein
MRTSMVSSLKSDSASSARKHGSRMEWIPPFPDGSGWDLKDKKVPYFYEHINLEEVKKLKAAQAKQLYKIIMIVPTPIDYRHKDIYFVEGSHLDHFLEGCSECVAYIVSVEPVKSMPSTHEKLT